MPGTKTQVASHHVRSVRTIRVRTARSSRAPTRAPERQLAETDGQNPAAGAPYEQAHPAIEGGSTRERAGGRADATQVGWAELVERRRVADARGGDQRYAGDAVAIWGHRGDLCRRDLGDVGGGPGSRTALRGCRPGTRR